MQASRAAPWGEDALVGIERVERDRERARRSGTGAGRDVGDRHNLDAGLDLHHAQRLAQRMLDLVMRSTSSVRAY
jgi:hypothetical protein